MAGRREDAAAERGAGAGSTGGRSGHRLQAGAPREESWAHGAAACERLGSLRSLAARSWECVISPECHC